MASRSAAKSKSGRPSATISASRPDARSIKARTTWPSRPVTAIRMKLAVGVLQEPEPLSRVALPKRLPPPLVVEIPLHRLLDTRLEVFPRAPAELILEL